MSIIDDIMKHNETKHKELREIPIKSYYSAELEHLLLNIGVKHKICSVTNGYITLISCIIGEIKDEEDIEVDMLYYTNARYVRMGAEEELVFITIAITGLNEEDRYILLKIEKLLSDMNLEKV